MLFRSKNTCIHCPTLELAEQVLSILHQLCLKWCSGNHYIRYTNWYSNRENTVYYPFEGEFSSLNYAHLIDYKIIHAEEFIALHRREEFIALPTEGKEFDLENYTPKGDLIGFPKEIISRMLECQEEQGAPRDISVFERDRTAGQYVEGFARYKTKEGNRFWYEVINNKDFNPFFEKYPKQDNIKINNKMTTEELESYTPKGNLKRFPKEIISRMLDCQEEQGNPRDVSIFENRVTSEQYNKGFAWDETKEGYNFWYDVINNKDFNLFFEKYPKQDNLKINNKMTTEELENYSPKGELQGFPKEIISRMLDCQEEQGNTRDVSVFERDRTAEQYNKGFEWYGTKEGQTFWHKVINNKNFNLFFEKYPKQDNSQDFRINDKVYDILRKEVGVVQDIVYPYGLSVEFKPGIKTSYTTNGCYYIPECKNPQLLHYRDDYNYNVIDFSNLPKRQEPKRWRATEGGTYYSFTFDFKVVGFYDTKRSLDNKAYDSGDRKSVV